MASSSRASEAPVVLSSLALKGAMEALGPALPPHRVRFGATQALLASIAAGERFDLAIVTAEGVDRLLAQGRVRLRIDLGRSGVGVAVRSGAARPSILKVGEFKSALLEAESVAHSKVGASGLYFAQLLQDLGLAGRLKKVVVVESGPVGAVVAAGGAELGVQQLCELAPVPGIDIVGPLPAELQRDTVFSAGIATSADDAPGAQALVDFLRSPAAAPAMARMRLEPAG